VIGLGLQALLGQLPMRLSLLRSLLRPTVDVRSPAATYTQGVPRLSTLCTARTASAAEWTA
jgi:hypothetical protein